MTTTPRARLMGVLGAACALPFVLLNLTVVFRIEPLFSAIRPGVHAGPLEYPLLILALLLLPVGAAVALAPVWHRAWRREGVRRAPVANVVIALLLVVSLAAIAVPLGSDIVRCDVLKVQNCD
ncbi:MAG: hypothetical protein LCH96_09440 [Actinobacteria bacterium]|nr:hypothetical protein [Actinomycetota bacterium]